ncbi:YfdX family protein [Obesumbacterium proteus]|uniref:YfdX family protein n=1 Tax=Obesumbacterium proteus TaxID=82983 RepID=UPI00242B248E|nr:YfdX family protein [Obesumbacterium proteus]
MKRILTATALSLAMMSTFTWAADGATTAPAATTTVSANVLTAQQAKEVAKVAQQGFNAMRDVQYARVSLFRGYPDVAQKLVDQAQTLLSDDSTNWKDFIKADKKTPLAGDNYVVINASISLAEDFVATPEKQKAIDNANAKFKKGDHKGAMEELRLAGVGVTETQYLMPLKQTQQAVKKAQQLLKEGKYYEANLALKGAEEGIITDSVSLVDAN